MSSRTLAGIVVVALAAFTAAGCSSSSKTASPTTSSPTTSAAPTSTDAPVATTTSTTQPAGPIDVSTADFPETPVSAPIGEPYTSAGAAFDAPKFAVAAGAITASWYRAGDSWVVYFRGLTTDQVNGKCPGTSLTTATDSEHVSNSPYGALACKGFTGNVLPPGSLRLCAAKYVVYTSQVPIDGEGTLVASLEQGLGDGSIQGMASKVAADGAKAPEIDVSGCQVVS